MADLSLVSRPKKNAKGRSADFMLSAILYSGRPVLVLPQRRVARLGQRVVIAWNQSRLAARAVSAAMPFLQSAESVHIVACGREDRPGPKSAALSRYLAQWGVASTREVTPGRNPEKEMAAVCKKRRTDLVVMGAYSRSRMRQLVLGGFTQHMLFDTSRPVFVVHD
jgi:nucleotide-binding universal stress UspA family protein